MSPRRREFLMSSAALLASGRLGRTSSAQSASMPNESFTQFQERRRKALWSLLGDLPWQHTPGAPRVVATEKHDGYTLQRLVLDLNGIEPVPALLLIPDKRSTPAPGLLYIHWHGGMYDLGKEQLLRGVDVQPAYAPVCVEHGLVTLAIDSWCFGERKRNKNGHVGEEDAFKLMLWNGQVLYGMMMFDEVRALDYLASRPEVDPHRLGTMGMSMGATKAWWLAALDPRAALRRRLLPHRCGRVDQGAGAERPRHLLLRPVTAQALPDGRDQRADRAAAAHQRERKKRSSHAAGRRRARARLPRPTVCKTREGRRLPD